MINHFLPPRKSQSVEDNMIPMINIVFLLLIFFMVAGKIKPSPEQGFELPESSSGSPAIEQEVTLQLSNDNRLQVDGRQVLLENLNRELDSFPVMPTHISLKADKRVKAAELDELLSILRARGIATVTLYATQKESS